MHTGPATMEGPYKGIELKTPVIKKLMDDVWKLLPDDLVLKIIELSEPTIDTKLAFKIRTKKICDRLVARIEYLLGSREGLIYNYKSTTLHDFRMQGFHIIRRPYELNWFDQNYAAFNQLNEYHNLEIYTPTGDFMFYPNHSDSSIVDNLILLRG